jgi:hypothetical protein
MRTLYPGLLGIACCAFVLNCSGQAVSQNAEAVDGNQKASFSAPASPSVSELPDSPGFLLLAQQTSAPQSSPQSQAGQPPDNPAPPAAGAQGTDQKLQRPVGTAAAEAPKVNGITAAQPAGVAIAPAKQKRVRTIVIRVGVIVGAGAALGTVIALTQATSSKPPGAH